MRILVVDDDREVRIMVCRMLRDEGHEVCEAGNGKEALRLLDPATAVDLVITDLIMPDKEGVETIFQLRRSWPQIKIVAMSGGGRLHPEYHLQIAKAAGAAVTLEKPFTKGQLLSAIQTCFGEGTLSAAGPPADSTG